MKKVMPSAVIIVAFLLFCIGFDLLTPKDQATNTTEQQQQSVQAPQAVKEPVCEVDASKLLGYINAERNRLGAPSLTLDTNLSVSSREKLDDMIAGRYYGHNMLSGESMDDFIRNKGINAKIAENIGSSDRTPENSWTEFKNSPSHYNSIIDPSYTRIGISVQCTDYIMEHSTGPFDNSGMVGQRITDLTVIHLAGEEPAPAPQTKKPSMTRCYGNSYGSYTSTYCFQ